MLTTVINVLLSQNHLCALLSKKGSVNTIFLGFFCRRCYFQPDKSHLTRTFALTYADKHLWEGTSGVFWHVDWWDDPVPLLPSQSTGAHQLCPWKSDDTSLRLGVRSWSLSLCDLHQGKNDISQWLGPPSFLPDSIRRLYRESLFLPIDLIRCDRGRMLQSPPGSFSFT